MSSVALYESQDVRRSRSWQNPQLTAAVTGTAAVAVSLVVFALAHTNAATGPATWELVLAVVALLAADTALVHHRTGHDAESVTFAEPMLAIALLLLPWSYLLPVAGLCVVVAHAFRGRPPLKTVFNASSFVIGSALAALVIGISGGVDHVRSIGPYDLVTVCAALLVFYVWNGLGTATVVALSAHRPVREIYLSGMRFRTMVAAGNIVAGLVLVILARWAPRALAVLPPMLTLLYVVYRSYLTAARDRDLWRELELATKEMNRLDEGDAAATALRHAVRLFKAEWAELVLDDPEGGPPTTHRFEERTGAATPAGAETCAMARLTGPDGELGTLRVGVPPQVKLTERELQALTTYARTVTTTLLNARLHATVRREGERAAHEAAHDSLTGLANRTLLLTRAARCLADAERSGTCVALLLIDLDHFKEINDTLGHAAGDQLLTSVAARLRGAIPEGATIARLGGDEFAVLLPGLTHPDAAAGAAQKLLHVLCEPITFDGLRLSIEGSMGVACYPHDGARIEELLQRADVAMYQAKDDRGAWRRYDPERDASSLDRMALVAQLRAAMEHGELTTYFQPQIDLLSGTIVGCEALVRWRHPTRGLLEPSEFVSVAEHSGLVRQFTLHVLDRAVAECALWHRLGRPVTVAVNLSARNLLDRQLPDDVARVLTRQGLAPEYLVLEITETTMMSELEVVEDVLSALRRLGVELSVDDFGTGYSSLALLQRIAVNEVKIDRSFVSSMLESPSDHAIVRATIELGHSLGLRVVGEGVETPELQEALRALGCDLAQGFHFGRPAPASDVRVDLTERGERARGATPLIPMPRRRNLTVLRPTAD